MLRSHIDATGCQSVATSVIPGRPGQAVLSLNFAGPEPFTLDVTLPLAQLRQLVDHLNADLVDLGTRDCPEQFRRCRSCATHFFGVTCRNCGERAVIG